MGKTGIFALMFSLHVVCGSAAKFALAARRNHPKAPPDSSGCGRYIAPQGLISETNVFNMIDQDW
jgi:hypothetical protein